MAASCVRLHLALLCPEIPNNTGAIARTAIGLGARLHLVKPYGFELSEARVRRAGLDYWPQLDLQEHSSAREFLSTLTEAYDVSVLLSGQRRRGAVSLWDVALPSPGTAGSVMLVFGNETKGVEHLPADVAALLPRTAAFLPQTTSIRSFNLACAVAMAGAIVAHRIGAVA